MARGKAPELSPTTRGRIMGFVRFHIPYRRIQELMEKEFHRHVALGSITRLKKHEGRYGNLKNLPRSGRPKSTSLSDEKHIVSLIDREKARNAADLCRNYYNHLSVSTIQRVFKRGGLHAYRPRKVPHLNKFQRRVRRFWAKGFLDWDFNVWRLHIFSDESKFNLVHSDGRDFVWRRKGEAYNPKYTIRTKKFGGGKVMVWGCITPSGVGQLHRITGIMNADVYVQILTKSLLGTLRSYGLNSRRVIFQQDNDPKHTSKKARQWFAKNGFILLPWPAQSPDLNPIENLWDYVARRVAKRDVQPGTEDQLWEALQEEWYRINPGLVRRLYEGMPKRLAMVIRRKGWNIPY